MIYLVVAATLGIGIAIGAFGFATYLRFGLSTDKKHRRTRNG